MTEKLEIRFASLDATSAPTIAVLAGQDLSLGKTARELDERSQGALRRAAAAADFKGKARGYVEILAPARLELQRLILLGTGKAADMTELDWINLGGRAYAQITARDGEEASIVAEPEGIPPGVVAERAAEIGYGALLRSYNFKKYRTRKDQDSNGSEAPRRLARLTVHCAEADAARRRFASLSGVAGGIFLARDLVNEPANALGPVEFADRLQELSRLGLEVDVLDDRQLRELKLDALLAVAQGSARPARVVTMQWNGAKSKRAKPLCFVGKGVVFDTGGLSMKPASGMEDMKGDMGGAACVSGLMQALAARKASVNAVGLVGLVENMPSGTAQRPGDIVTSMSGQTIEVLNTDAEGRLVLADVLWLAQDRYKPRLIIDLATLTGAIMVALGKEYAGLFSNDDRLAAELADAGEATGEKVWRMPMSKAYDKLIDSKNADIKNIGGRYGGAITAAQFLKRFIKDVPWAHLDVAGTAMDSSRNDLNQSWGGGWGVRLLDRFVANSYEKQERQDR